MLSELEYYRKVARDAVCVLRHEYWVQAIKDQIGLDDRDYDEIEENADDIAEEKVVEQCDLSPYQLADFMYGEYDPYADYCDLKNSLGCD